MMLPMPKCFKLKQLSTQRVESLKWRSDAGNLGKKKALDMSKALG